jgi:hypothetical protein
MRTAWFHGFAVSTVLAMALGTAANAQTAVLTRSYDNGRTGSNVTESVLTPQLLATKGLRLSKSLVVDDDPRIEAQPLYVPKLRLADGTLHDVVFVATMANQVWAFDADAPRGNDLLWKVSLKTPFTPTAGVQVQGRCKPRETAPNNHRCTAIDWWGVNIKWGILSTPVIDADAQMLYVANWVADQNGKRALFLHRIRLRDRKVDSLPIQAALKGADGKPVEDSNGRPVTLHPDQKIRAALLLAPLHGAHKTLFAATTGGENPGDPHGWVVAFDVDSFRQTASWVSTPSSFGGGIWQGSQGPAADDAGNVYALTGNGGYFVDTAGHIRDFEGDTDFAEAFVKLKYTRTGAGQGTLSLADWFIAFRDSERQQNVNGYNYQDQDLGSAAPLVPSGTEVVLGAGKDGLLYVLDRNNLGKMVGDPRALKSTRLSYVTFNGLGLPTSVGASGHDLDFPLGTPGRVPDKTHHLHGSPVYWDGANGPMLFSWGENESLRAWKFDPLAGTVSFVGKSAEIASAAAAASPQGFGGMTGGMLTLSSNGKVADTGIVWATAPIDGDANHDIVAGIVRAYDATRLADTPLDRNTPRLKLLWDNTRAGVTFNFSKFCPPVVADGRLLVTTYDGRVDIYVPNR